MVDECPRDFTPYLDHDRCREHAACNVITDQGNYWDYKNCPTCSEAVQTVQVTKGAVMEAVLKPLKSWIKGYQRNTKGWYLPSEEMRLLIFPKAALSAVYGVPPTPPLDVASITLDERMDVTGEEDVTAEEELVLLQEDEPGESGGTVSVFSNVC